MSTKFTPEKFQVDKESESLGDMRVVKLEEGVGHKISSFEPGGLTEQGRGDYATTRAKYGKLATTDKDRTYRSQKDTRFSLSELLRKPLSVEEEERRAIEEKVRARVASMADEVREKARTEGYQEGLQKGYEEAFRRFQQEGAERLARFEKLLGEAENAKQEIFRANERYLMELLFRIARTVLLREAQTDRQLVLRLARELIERVGVRENIRIKVHPDDAATIEMLKEGIEQALGSMKNLAVEVSNQIKGGGCAVETEWNAIDASIDTQLNGLYEALIGGGSGGGTASA
jgi:flagellar assembly protein FliH